MRQKDLLDILRGDAMLFETPHKARQTGGRAALEECARYPAEQQERRRDPLGTHEVEVYGLYLDPSSFLATPLDAANRHHPIAACAMTNDTKTTNRAWYPKVTMIQPAINGKPRIAA